MSISFLKFSCKSCDFSGSSLVTFGLFRYRDGNSFFPIERALGLCLDCKEIVAIEQLPDINILRKARKFRAKYAGEPLLRLLEKDIAKYLGSQKYFEVLEKVVELKRPSVCLKCGSGAIREIKVPDELSSENSVALRLTHPWCKGPLQVKHSGSMRIAPMSLTRTYNIHGQLISEVPTPPHSFDVNT